MKRTEYTKADFTWSHWTPTDIKRVVPQLLTLKKARFTAIKKIKNTERTFENTVYALDASYDGISDAASQINILQEASPDKAVRTAAQQAIKTLEKSLIAIERDPQIWKALKEYEAGAWKQERKNLSPVEHKLFHDILLDFKRMGFDLPPQKQVRLKKIDQEISRLGSEFGKNINNHKDHIVVPEADMAGLPDIYKQGLKRDEKGRFVITLAYPDYIPFMEFAHSEAHRKALAEKYSQKGGAQNLKILEKLVTLRREKAKLLGYKNYADYRTEPRMAKSGDVAFGFINSLFKRTQKGGKADLAELRALKQQETKDSRAVLHPYDISYYGHKLRKMRFNLNSEEVREYFPLERVLGGTLEIYSRLFGVKFQELTGTERIELWHPDVKLYKILTTNNETFAYFAIDLHPREGKYGHACVLNVIDGRSRTFMGDEYVTPFAVMLTNFAKPTETIPSLLSHGEAETFLHEFGHIMHCTLTKARYASQSGSHTAWDFVEAPSQMFENWGWNKQSLKLLSSHYKTGKPLPEKILTNLLKSERHMLRYATLRQTVLATLDLKLHTENKTLKPNKLYAKITENYTGMKVSPKSLFPADFSHLAGSYDAGYYGYLWSKVYATDMFTRFAHEGILNKKTGADYRKAILEQGGSKPEIELVKEFLGRKPNNKAFLKEIGITN